MSDHAKPVGFMHMSVTREYLLGFLDAHPEDFASVVSGAKTFEEARTFIANGPASYPLGECPDYTDENGCPGHERKDKSNG